MALSGLPLPCGTLWRIPLVAWLPPRKTAFLVASWNSTSWSLALWLPCAVTTYRPLLSGTCECRKAAARRKPGRTLWSERRQSGTNESACDINTSHPSSVAAKSSKYYVESPRSTTNLKMETDTRRMGGQLADRPRRGRAAAVFRSSRHGNQSIGCLCLS